MSCRVVLVNTNNNKVIKEQILTRDTYPLCEKEITERNKPLKEGRLWVITHINV